MGKKKRKTAKREKLSNSLWQAIYTPHQSYHVSWDWGDIVPLQQGQAVLVGGEQFIVFGGGVDEDLT